MRIKHLNRFRTRRSERAPVKAAVSFRNRQGEISYGWARDIGLGGIYVHTDDRERLGSLCEMGLTIKRPEGIRRLAVRGQAARHDDGGIAFQFCDLPEEARELIIQIIEEHLRRALGAKAPKAEDEDEAEAAAEAEAAPIRRAAPQGFRTGP